MSKTAKEIIISLTVANLCFMSAWRTLLNPLHYSYYHWKFYPGLTEYIALFIDILLLAALFYAGAALVRRFAGRASSWLLRAGLLLVLIIPLNDLRLEFIKPQAPAVIKMGGALLAFIPLVLILIATVMKRWRAAIYKVVVALILIVSPFTLITFVQGAWLAFKYRPHAALAKDAPAVPLSSSRKPASRVVWMVFDELDQRMAFSQRPAGLQLPELDRLRSEAVFADNAYPPAGETLLSMPALVTGTKISRALQLRPNELMVTLPDGKEVGLSTQPNVFSTARAAGFDTAVVGWYHPYCRVLAGSFSSCFWEPVVDDISPLRGEPTIAKSMSHWVSMFLFRIPGVFRLFKSEYDSDRSRDHIEEYQHIMERSRKIVSSREFGLTLLHFPIPHHPFIYDRDQNALSSRPDNDYADNLALTDKTLGEMRRELESAGLWDETTVIVTADHWWRTSPDGKVDKHIPFIVKLAGQKEGKTYTTAFNTIITSKFIMAVLNGEVTNPDAAMQWLNQNLSSAQPVVALAQ